MTRRAAAILALLLVLGIAAGPAQAGWLDALVKAGRVSTKAGRVVEEGAAAAAAVRTVRVLSPEVRALGEGAEATRYGSAFGEVEGAIAIGKVEIQRDAFHNLIRSSALQRADWTDGVPLSDDMPNVLVKAPHTPGAAEALRMFARSRLDEVIDAPFSVTELKIVPLAMADDVARSGKELAAFRRTIPSDQLDLVGPLSHPPAGKLSREEMIRQLQPYEGKTVVVVGHVSEQEGGFLAHLPNGETRPIPIADWMAAAQEAKVNLIPIGCNSEKIGSIGTRGLINSGTVRRAIAALIERRPATMGGFLQALTSKDLQIVIDPVAAHLFESGIVLRSKVSGRDVARIGMQGMRMLRSPRSPLEDGTAGSAFTERTDPCFARGTAATFDSCIENARRTIEADLIARVRECRDNNVKILPAMIEQAEAAYRGTSRKRLALGTVYALAALAAAWLVLVSQEARRDQQEHGNRLRFVFGRWRAREVSARFTGQGAALGLTHPLSDVILAGVVLALAFGALFVMRYPWYVDVAYAFAGLVTLGILIEAGKRALTNTSLVDATQCLTLLVATSAGIAFLVADTDLSAQLAERDRLHEDYRLARTSPAAGDKCTTMSPYTPVPVHVVSVAPPEHRPGPAPLPRSIAYWAGH